MMSRMLDPSVQVEVALRLVLAAAFGAAIGAEREAHGHPAGMRTHLLVAVGAGLFTVVSIFGFDSTAAAPVDPSRVAAQIVSGIGFLGAGAILKEGFSIRGLTTAASLWATAAIGMAAGVGAFIVGAIATGLVILSLWPLNAIADRLRARRSDTVAFRLDLDELSVVGIVEAAIAERGGDVRSIDLARSDGRRLTTTLEVKLSAEADPIALARVVAELPGVRAVATERQE